MTTKAIATIKRSPDLSGCGNASDAILDQTCINTIRTLSMDAVQQANSGHPRHAYGIGSGDLHFVATVSTV